MALPSRQLIIEPSANNIGDTFVNVGARRLVPGLGCGYALTIEPEFYEDNAPWFFTRTAYNYDAIYIVGTPWFFQGWSTTGKSHFLTKLSNRYPSTPMVMLSAGHCSPSLGSGSSPLGESLGDHSLIDRMELIVCRDRFAYDYASGVAVEPHKVVLAKCASHAAFTPEDFGSPERSGSVCVWMDFQTLTGHEGYRSFQAQSAMTPEQWQTTIDYEAGQADAVAVNSRRDVDVFREKFGKRPDISCRDPYTYAESIARFDCMVSARVHSATIGHALGLDVRLLAADTRADTAYLCGVEPYLDLPRPDTGAELTSWDDIRDTLHAFGRYR